MLKQEQEEYLKKRMMSVMLCANWVCAGTFVDHERVSASTNIQQEEEFLSMAIGFQNRCSERGTMESIVVFSTHGFESNFGT